MLGLTSIDTSTVGPTDCSTIHANVHGLNLYVLLSSGGHHPFPGMHFPPYASTMGQATYNLSASKDTRSAFHVPPVHSPASCLPSTYPGTRMPGNPHHPYTRGTLGNHNWPVAQQLVMPVEKSATVHLQQGCHYHHSACHMSFYNCCTHICRPADHYPYPKRPRIDRDNLPAGEKVTAQILQKDHAVPCKTLPSPPPLIKNCESGLDLKKSKQTHFGENTEKKSPAMDKTRREHSITIRESSEMEIEFPKVALVNSSAARYEFSQGCYKNVRSLEVENKRKTNGHQQRRTCNELDKCDTSPLGNHGNGDGGCKDCADNRRWSKRSNTPDPKTETRSTRSVRQLEKCFTQKPSGETRHCTATQEDSPEKCDKRDGALLQNNSQGTRIGYSCDEDVSQGGHPKGPKKLNRSQSAPLDQQTGRHIKPRDDRGKGDNSCENKPAINDYKTNNPNMSSMGRLERSTDSFKYQQQPRSKQLVTVPSDTIHPQLQYYPPSNNLQRFRSKSCDDPLNFTLKSQASVHKPFKSGISYYKSQMQSVKPREQGCKNKLIEYDYFQIRSPTSGRYQRSKSMFCNIPQNSRNMQSNGDEKSSVSSCYGISNKSTAEMDNRTYYQSIANKNSNKSLNRLTYEHQVRVETVRPPLHQQANMSRKGSNSGNSMPSHQENQILSSDKTNHHMQIYQDQNQVGELRNYDDVFHCEKSSSIAKNEPPKVRTLCPDQNGTRSLTPRNDSIKISGVTSLDELRKRRTKLSDVHKSPGNCLRFDDTTQFHCKVVDTKRFEGDQKRTDLTCGEHDQQDMKRFLDERTVVQSTHIQEPTKYQRRYQREIGLGNLGLPTSGRNVESQNHKAETNNIQDHYPNIGNGQEAGTLPPQTAVTSSHSLPPLPSGNDLDNLETDCGGYAIDHSALPRIVAVHSIVAQEEAMEEDESNPFSPNDKKYWNDLLHKLTNDSNGDGNFQQSDAGKILEINHTTNLNNQSQKHTVKKAQDVTLPSQKESRIQQEYDAQKWTLWKYLSSPSRELTIEVKSPTEYVEVLETKKKPQSTKRKPTVSELSKKILYTRERIKQETIPWKKKLLFSLEATFIKRLRKTEKETGEKADIVIEEENVEEELKEKKKDEREKCNKRGRKKKLAKGFKETTKAILPSKLV